MRRDAKQNLPPATSERDEELLSPEVFKALRDRPLAYPKAESTRRVMAMAERRIETRREGAPVKSVGEEARKTRRSKADVVALFGGARWLRPLAATAALLVFGVVGAWVWVAQPGLDGGGESGALEVAPIRLSAVVRAKDPQLSEADQLLASARNRMAEREALLDKEARLADTSELDQLLSRTRARAKDLRQKTWVETNVLENTPEETPGPSGSSEKEPSEDLA